MNRISKNITGGGKITQGQRFAGHHNLGANYGSLSKHKRWANKRMDRRSKIEKLNKGVELYHKIALFCWPYTERAILRNKK